MFLVQEHFRKYLTVFSSNQLAAAQLVCDPGFFLAREGKHGYRMVDRVWMMSTHGQSSEPMRLHLGAGQTFLLVSFVTPVLSHILGPWKRRSTRSTAEPKGRRGMEEAPYP